MEIEPRRNAPETHEKNGENLKQEEMLTKKAKKQEQKKKKKKKEFKMNKLKEREK